MPIPIPVPYGVTYTASASGTAWKLVTCDHCQKRYAYELTRFAKGEGFSPLFLNKQGAENQAGNNALQRLQSKLDKEFDTVPCPHCGNYQKYMRSKVRKNKPRRSGCGPFLLLPASLLFGLYFLISLNQTYTSTVLWTLRVFFWSATLTAGLGSFYLFLAIVHYYRYEPNNADELETRLKIAQSRALYGEALDKLLAGSIANK